MKLLKELVEASGFENFVALTFNLNLAWLECLLLRQLDRSGVRRMLVLADETELSETLDRQIGLLEGLGRRYSVHGVGVAGRFHPKAFLLTGSKKARLYIGSGNLTLGGLDRNCEIFERFEVSAEDDQVPAAFGQFRTYLQGLTEHFLTPPRHVTEILDASFGAAVLGKPEGDTAARLLGSPSSLLPLLPAPPTPANRLTIAAPFFDANGDLAARLAAALRAKHFEVVTDTKMTTLTRSAARRIKAAGGEVRILERSKDEVRGELHAKAIFAEGQGWKLSAHGSANASVAAWTGLNAELLVLHQDEGAEQVRTLLDELQTRALSAADLAFLDQQEQARESSAASEAESPSGPSCSFADWVDEATVEVASSSPLPHELTAEFKAGDLQSTARVQLMATGRLRVKAPTGIERHRAVAIRLLAGEAAGAWCAVHDPRSLRDHGSGRAEADRRIEQFLGDDPNDPHSAQNLIEFLAGLWSDRQAREVVEDDGKVESEPSGKNASEKRWFSHTEFDEPSGHDLPTHDGAGHLDLSPSSLLRRLLFTNRGLDADARDSEDVDSSEAGHEGDPAPAGTHRRAPDLTEVATHLRRSFLQHLKDTAAAGRSATRLVEDLLVVTVALQRSLRTGGLEARHFLAEELPVLRAFIGEAHALLPKALRELGGEDQSRFWSEVPVVPAVAGLLYNCCLAEVAAVGHLDGLSAEFPGAHPVLWMRNILRHAPAQDVHQLRRQFENQLPRLKKTGDLWLGDLWPFAELRVSFPAFFEGLLTDSFGILAAERCIKGRLQNVAATRHEDGALVVGVGRDGGLAAGFVEAVELTERQRANPALKKNPPILAFLYDAAFQVRDPDPGSPHPRYAPMHKGATKLAALEELERWFPDAEGSLADGLKVLRRLCQ